MALFQELGKRLSDTARTVGKKAAEASELSRLNGQLSDINQEIERLYGQVGKAYYTARGSKESSESADAFCDRIDSLREELSQVEHTIDQRRNRYRCKKCGAVLSPQAKYCLECGAKVEEFDEETPEPEKPEKPKAKQGDVEPEIIWPEAHPAQTDAKEEDAPESSAFDEEVPESEDDDTE